MLMQQQLLIDWMRYCDQRDQATEDDIQPLYIIQHRMDLLCVVAQKQSSIMDFFTAVTN